MQLKVMIYEMIISRLIYEDCWRPQNPDGIGGFKFP